MEKDATYRKCMRENIRTYETMNSWDTIAKIRKKTHNLAPQQRQAQLGNQWNVNQTQSVQRANASQARSPSTQTLRFREFLKTLRTRSRILRTERRCRATLSPSAHHLSHSPSDCTTYLCCCAAISFSIVGCWRLKSQDGSSPISAALTSTSLSWHICHRTSSTAQILTAPSVHEFPHLCHCFGCLSISLSK